ncbi:MAG: hypothetical protein HYX48_00985 [Chlamydiales bacterium]|nr:hypothetical protein [Chlamydiales bacterium]
MSSQANELRISEPVYYHREYTNDLGAASGADSWLDSGKRAGAIALPFLGLYKPLGLPISLTMGGLRTWSCATHLIDRITEGDTGGIAYGLLQTMIAVVALAGTMFAHPMGMFISTGHDVVIDGIQLIQYLYQAELQKALESWLSVTNNVLYLVLFLDGGLEIAVASFAMQTLVGLYRSLDEFIKGNWQEGTGHLVMGLIRGNQLAGQVKVLQMKWELQDLVKKMNTSESNNYKAYGFSASLSKNMALSKNTSAQDLIAVTEKYQKYKFPKGFEDWNKISPPVKACVVGDKEAILIFLKHGYDLNLTIPTCNAPILEFACYAWGNKYMGLENVNKIDMFNFLISYGADINKCHEGLKFAILEFRYETNAIGALKLAIQKGACLKGKLSYTLYALSLPHFYDSAAYFRQVAELLVESGAKLD